MNGKITLRIPQITLFRERRRINIETFISILGIIEIVSLIILPLTALTALTIDATISNWLTLIFVALGVRLIKFLLVGPSAFPSTKFDLSLLTAITSLLLFTILQGNRTNYQDLGGTNIWGVSSLLLFSLTLYLLVIVLPAGKILRVFMFSTKLSVAILILRTLTTSSALGSYGYAAFAPLSIPLLILSVSGLLYYKNVLLKVFYVLMIIIGLVATIPGLNSPLLLLTIAIASYTTAYVLYRNKFESIKMLRNIREIIRGKYIAAAFIILGTISSLLLLITPGTLVQLNALINSYITLGKRLTTLPQWLIGRELVSASPSITALVFSYGILGLLAMIILGYVFTRQIIGQTHKAANRRELFYHVAILFSLLFLFTALFTAGINQVTFMWVIALTGFGFITGNNQKPTTGWTWNNIRGKTISTILVNLRVLAAIALVVMLPGVITLLLTIF